MELFRGLPIAGLKPTKKRQVIGDSSHIEILEELHAQLEGEKLREDFALASAAVTEAKIETAWQSEVSRYQTLNQRLNSTYRVVEKLLGELTDEKTLEKEGIEKFAIKHGWLLGAEISLYNLAQRFRDIAKDKEGQEQRERFADLLEFICWGPILRFGDKTLLDFYKVNPKKASPVPYLEYLINAVSIGKGIPEEEIVKANPNQISQTYPAVAKTMIRAVATEVKAIIGLTAENFPTANLPQTLREAAPYVQKICDNTEELRRRSYCLFLDPDAHDFPALQRLLEKNLKSNDFSLRKAVWFLLGLNSRSRVNLAYRAAVRFIQEGKNPEFYQFAVNSIDRYIEAQEDFLKILSREEIPTILYSNNDSEEAPTYEKMGSVVSEIFGKSSERLYSIDPGNISWSRVRPPQEAEIVFDRDKPRVFTVILDYRTEKGQAIKVSYTIDTVKKELDWDWKEDPNYPEDEEINSLKNAFLSVGGKILEDVLKQAAQRYEARKNGNPKNRPAGEQGTNKKTKERYEDPVYKLRKVAREEREVLQTPEAFFRDLESPEPEKVKITILLPEEEKLLERLFKSVSAEDKMIITEKIRRLTELGIGADIKKLRLPGPDGEPIYSLGISCNAPGGARVLLIEIESRQGERVFRIHTIGYRKDVYAKAGV